MKQCDYLSIVVTFSWRRTLIKTRFSVNFWDHLLNVNISMTVGQIFTKIGTFIENRQTFMLLMLVQKFSSGTGSPGWSQKKGRKMVVFVCVCRQDTCSAKASILLTWCQRVLTTATLQSPVQLVFCCSVRLLLATCEFFTYLFLEHKFQMPLLVFCHFWLFFYNATIVVLWCHWLWDRTTSGV